MCEVGAEGDAVVAGEGPGEAPRGGLDAEEGHGKDDDDGAEHGGRGAVVVGRELEDADDGVAGVGADGEDGVDVGDAVEDGEDVGEGSHAIDDDGPDHGAGDVDRGVVGFFGHVHDAVDAGEGEGGG